MKCTQLHKKKKPELELRLPSYAPLNIIVRFAIISLIAVLILHFIVLVTKTPARINERIPAFIYVVVIVIFNVAVELQIVLDNILE